MGKRTLLLGSVLAAALLAASTASAQITIDTVLVGNSGNAADTSGYGAVGYEYHIGTYEVTNAQYAVFLNAVDPTGTNPNEIYDGQMGLNTRGGISFNAGAAAGSKYATRANMGNKPVNYVSYWAAMRFTNWLSTGDTETGVYILTTDGINPPSLLDITRDEDAWLAGGVAIASENEWYKAAYYNGNGGYWDYPTQSDTAPTSATANSTGDVDNPGANVANYSSGADWNGQNGNVTTVGSATAASHYGTFDQGGNVWEWNDEIVFTANSGRRRGGSFFSTAGNMLLSGWRTTASPNAGEPDIGFRVSSLTAIVDEDPPTVVSIERLDPMSATATPVGGVGGSVTFRVTFSEDVQNVDVADFAVTGDATTGGVTDVSQVSASVYDVTVGNITTTGTVGLSVLAAQGPG